MGLGDMVKNVFHTFGEMKEMAKLQDELPNHLKEIAEKFSLDTADVEKLTEKFMK